MAYVEATGRLTDAGNTAFLASLEPRLWAVPEKSASYGPGLITDDEVLCELNTAAGANAGQFSVMLQNAPGMRYTLWLDRLVPGQQGEPPEKRARQWVQWSKPFHPGEGGRIGDLMPVDVVGLIWIGQTPPPGGPPWPKDTRWLDSNPSSPDFGWIKKWS